MNLCHEGRYFLQLLLSADILKQQTFVEVT